MFGSGSPAASRTELRKFTRIFIDGGLLPKLGDAFTDQSYNASFEGRAEDALATDTFQSAANPKNLGSSTLVPRASILTSPVISAGEAASSHSDEAVGFCATA